MNQEIENNIRNKIPWTQLPVHIKKVLKNPRDYDRFIVNFSIKNQLRYRGNLVRNILRDERRYYERVIEYSKERLMLFPYHLADMIVKGLRITPFNYYISVVERLMQTEKSYDTLPNFTAADCLRLLGIGRNEYIELMNRARSNKVKLFGKRNVRGLLPKVPCDIFIAPWWRVEVGLVLEEDVKMVNDEELAVIDRLIDLGSQTAGELDYFIILSLYKKGLIYLDVPVTAFDCIQVPPLQGFVMNRVTGDYFETLLYKIFVSIDKHTTVGELASVLEVDTELVKQAVSLYCRLQFAYKLQPETALTKSKWHPSWTQLSQLHDNIGNQKEVMSLLGFDDSYQTSPNHHYHQNDIMDSPDSTSSNSSSSRNRVAFLFDSTLTAFLMMGNLSPGLKKHAVTMFEVGKLCDEGLESLLMELEHVSLLDAEGEGEARRFFDHAVILKSTILALKKIRGHGLDLIRLESLHSLDEATRLRLLQKKYNLLVSMAPLSREVSSVSISSPPHLGPSVPEVNSLWFKLFLYYITGYGPPTLLLSKGQQLKRLPHVLLGYSRILVTTWLHEPSVIPTTNILNVNAAAQYSPVLIQAYGVHHTAETIIVPFPFRLNKKDKDNDAQNNDESNIQFWNHPAVKAMEDIIDLKHNCGYITFVNTGVKDLGSTDKERTIKFLKNKHIKAENKKPKDQQQPLSITNENFSFSNPTADKDPQENTTNEEKTSPSKSSSSSSPLNGFTSKESSKLLQQEIDKLCEKLEDNDVIDDSINSMSHTASVESLLSPNEDNISMFNRHAYELETSNDLNINKTEVLKNEGEVWTLLDCHFGVPLFDVNASTKICDAIVSGGLTRPESLAKLVESGHKLGAALLDFISQCQHRPDEGMEIIKRGKLIPLPRYSLVFDNGRISEWSGK